MKVIAFQSEHTAIVSMKVEEIMNFAGFGMGSEFNEAFDARITYSDRVLGRDAEKMIAIRDIPISEVYHDAKDILAAYEELRTKMESVRNQMTFLTNKMREAKEEA